MMINKWTRCVLVVLEIGGGFTGMSILLVSQPWGGRISIGVWIISVLLGLVFLLGIAAGLAVVEGQRVGILLSMVYQAIQIPVLSLPLLTYSVFSGVEVKAGWWAGKPVLLAGVGARGTLFVGRSEGPWGVGVNIVALCLFMWLLLLSRRRADAANRCRVIDTGTDGSIS